jgi:prepilin-type N-terminal cleavage/methylation domain-containing protein
MLEPMNMSRARAQCGFTIIELMTVMIVAAVLLALAIPSFRELIARNRLEGVTTEFVTDLQYARSEAVARNANVGLVTGAAGACYTIYQEANPVAGSCNCANTPACTGGPVEIKTVGFGGTGISATASTTFLFEPVRGSLTGATTQADLSSTAGVGQLRAEVLAVGRVKACSPSATFRGYPSC